MTTFGPLVGTVGVGDRHQIAHRLAQQWRIHPPRHLQQDRVGFELHLVGELAGAVGDHPGMGG
jgi:hypothetical protein